MKLFIQAIICWCFQEPLSTLSTVHNYLLHIFLNCSIYVDIKKWKGGGCKNKSQHHISLFTWIPITVYCVSNVTFIRYQFWCTIYAFRQLMFLQFGNPKCCDSKNPNPSPKCREMELITSNYRAMHERDCVCKGVVRGRD